jgi:hypothetical protein
MSIKDRLAKLEKPFRKYGMPVFIDNENELAEARKKHGKDVIVFINDLPPDPSEAQTILNYEARLDEMRYKKKGMN